MPVWKPCIKRIILLSGHHVDVMALTCLMHYFVRRANHIERRVPDWECCGNCLQLYLGVVLFTVVIVTATFSHFQESKSEQIMEGAILLLLHTVACTKP